MPHWNGHIAKFGRTSWDKDVPPEDDDHAFRDELELWLAGLMQSEHLGLLVGNGLTRATAFGLGASGPAMAPLKFTLKHGDKVEAHARETAAKCKRGTPNMEDYLRAAQVLIEGLTLLGDPLEKDWKNAFSTALFELVADVTATEERIRDAWAGTEADKSGMHDFLLSFANRPSSRERLDVFTTNYDRLIEHAAERLGLRILDRFVGSLEPRFRSSRVCVDVHFDPPGIRGEPRYLEGVFRLTKLHGSLDWRMHGGNVVRAPVPFGERDLVAKLTKDLYASLLIYPNAAKDVETIAYPYAELFRDFAAALCRPNTTVFTYGYSFGDDHINRVLKDMLTISSTHLVVVSFSDEGGVKDPTTGDYKPGRIAEFVTSAGHEDQVTLLMGPHFGNLKELVSRYLPRTVMEPLLHRTSAISHARTAAASSGPMPAGSGTSPVAPAGGGIGHTT